MRSVQWWRNTLVASVLSVALLPWGTASAQDEPAPRVQASAGSARAGDAAEVRVEAIGPDGPVARVVLTVQRSRGAGWMPVGDLTTGEDGTSSTRLVVDRDPANNRVRVLGGAAEALTSLTMLSTPSRVTLSTPAKVVDERTVTINLSRVTDRGAAVPGDVRLQRRVLRGGRWSGWTDFRTLRLDAGGRASTTVRPRSSHRWRAVAPAQTWVGGATSAVVAQRNVAPGRKVTMAKGAPKPRIKLGPQRRAVGEGPAVRVRRVPPSTWRTMKGVSWRRGCPVGRDDLRVVETNYWAFDGYRRRGQVVVAASVVANFRGLFEDFHAARVPIRSLRLPDRFGRSKRLGGADDLRSMAADNTSVFNCRGVVGQPGRRSPHSWGRSLDLNPWENPFRSAWGTVPNRWWASRSHPDVAWRSSKHRVVKILARHGFRWTYGHGDLHHFDAVPRAARSLREVELERSYQEALAACAVDHCD